MGMVVTLVILVIFIVGASTVMVFAFHKGNRDEIHCVGSTQEAKSTTP